VLFLLHGADELAMRRRLRVLRDEADGGTGMLDTNMSLFDARDARPGEVANAVISPPFLAPRRLVVVERLLDRFAARGVRGAREQPSSSAPPNLEDTGADERAAAADGDEAAAPDRASVAAAGAWEPLFAAVESGLPETTTLVLTGATIRGRNPLVDRLKRAGAVEEPYPELKPQELARYIRDEGAVRGMIFRDTSGGRRSNRDEMMKDPAGLLATLTEGNTLAIANELDKLALYTGGGEVRLADVAAVCSGDAPVAAWDLSDAIFDGRLEPALRYLATLLNRAGESTQGLLALLAGDYRRAATVLDLLEQGAGKEELAKAIRGGQFDFLREAAVARARRLGEAGVREAFRAIVETDRAIKSGEMPDDVAVEVLVARLCAIAASAGRR